MKKMIPFILAAVLLVPSVVAAADPEKDASPVNLGKAEIEAFANTFFQQKEVKDQLAGAVLVVVKNGQVMLNKGYGYADIDSQKPFDSGNTVFRVASVSKLFTAVGIMQLAEKGKLDLDKDVQAYLPDVQIPNKTGGPLTLKHLMTHTGGFDAGTAEDPQKTYSLRDFIKETVPTVITKPGEVFNYNNYGYDLQGYIIEKVSGLPFEEYMRKNLFAPLGMNNSDFIFTDKVKKAIATPYDSSLKQAQQVVNVPANRPAGGMFSTGADMAKFLMAMLNDDPASGHRILTEASIRAMEHNSVTIHPKIPGAGYGLESNYTQYYNGYNVVEKGGDLPGFHSNIWLLPDEKTGVFLASNSDKGNLRLSFFEQFMNRYFPKKGKGPTFVQPEPTKQQLLRFEGTYRDLRSPGWSYDISAVDGALIVKAPSGNHTLRQAEDLLFYDEEGVAAGFKPDADGNILYFAYNKPGSWSVKPPEMPKFQDVPDDHPYAEYIYELAQSGAIQGGSGRFEPDKPITRGQFIAMLVHLSTYPLSQKPSSFADTKGNQNEAYIQTAYEIGIANGFTNGMFNPDQPVTREEAATLVWRLVKIVLSAAPVQSDLKGPYSSWAAEGLQFVVGKQLFGPDVQTSSAGSVDYRPKDIMLKQEAAALLSQLLKSIRQIENN
ncbi:serine hydrolase [Paenibacillus graminis]|uniref:serine hydrolase n=1 Tax=Paenibacillus graminis TaxID=189425 RepID=UPI002DB9A6C3|nr:serine hydrolase [Paenibacillus graminis]MEC0170341.1 beta-lactamase family protein [Paenibacillus graminis]